MSNYVIPEEGLHNSPLLHSAPIFSVVYVGSNPIRMCPGPTGSILVLSLKEQGTMELSRFNWEKELQVLVSVQSLKIRKRLLGMCYAQRHDILICIYETEGVEAVRLDDKLSVIWSLSRVVDRLPVKPDSVTCDTDGNTYVGDGTRNAASFIVLVHE